MKHFAMMFAFALLFTVAGIALGFRLKEPILATCATVAANAATAIKNDDIRQAPDGSTKYTSPLLECAELPESVSEVALDATKTDVQKIIKNNTDAGNITEASVYFRDLNNGPWFGINEENKYFPASLLKLPLAMSFYEKSEDDPSLLTQEIAYHPDPSVTSQNQPFSTPEELVPGKKYTVQKLLDIMLTESNNEAANTLAILAGPEVIDNVYHDLGLVLPQPGQDYSITTHKYASFFRVLYNATYVDKTASEKILKTLTNATFNDGLVAGVPSEVNVSHKFGTRGVTADNTVVQLHDCGIIYAPKKPYILCIMTQGSDFTKLAGVIAQISKTVYNQVTQMQ